MSETTGLSPEDLKIREGALVRRRNTRRDKMAEKDKYSGGEGVGGGGGKMLPRRGERDRGKR